LIANDPKIELGIHPNFNDLLNSKSRDNNKEIVHKINDIVHHAVSLRSHSLTQSERLLDLFADFGFTHISNLFVPYCSSVITAPYNLWRELVIVPHQFQDNVEMKMNLSSFREQNFKSGFHVFDFHPIHVFLNTESLNRYELTRPLHHKPKELIKHRYEGYGTRSRLIELLKLCKES